MRVARSPRAGSRAGFSKSFYLTQLSPDFSNSLHISDGFSGFHHESVRGMIEGLADAAFTNVLTFVLPSLRNHSFRRPGWPKRPRTGPARRIVRRVSGVIPGDPAGHARPEAYLGPLPRLAQCPLFRLMLFLNCSFRPFSLRRWICFRPGLDETCPTTNSQPSSRVLSPTASGCIVRRTCCWPQSAPSTLSIVFGWPALLLSTGAAWVRTAQRHADRRGLRHEPGRTRHTLALNDASRQSGRACPNGMD